MLQKRERKNKKGFSLIELMVAMFIFVMIMGAMVAVSVAGFRSYIKSKAIKTVMEDVGFAMNSIAKDVRMGKIEKSFNVVGVGTKTNNGTIKDYFAVKRNRNQELACYHATSIYLGVATGTSGSVGPPLILASCPSDDGSGNIYKKIVDLTGTNMAFASTSGFYSMATDTTSATKIRGWVEINLNIENPGMDTDSIRLQTIVSSRDYGWDETP
ncbi:MAG: prepilin-type N-terminal cleavage/methylation domain-containing protein [Candidatus Moraniibacteriota bacterium]